MPQFVLVLQRPMFHRVSITKLISSYYNNDSTRSNYIIVTRNSIIKLYSVKNKQAFLNVSYTF